MKGDFTRFTFSELNDYAGVLMQQGRVQLDADWNEQLAIARFLREVTSVATIGQAGVPKGNPAFAISIAAGGTDLAVGGGRMFLDGIICDNRSATATLLNQPYLTQRTASRAGFDLPAASGRYVAYLDVWTRHITADRAPAIRETALGGPDTATREKTVWQVRLDAAPSATTRCADLPANWTPAGGISTGMMTAATPTATSTELCILPPTAGYRSLDNQLYRVEVLRGGTRDAAQPATFTWSRDNGIVAATVTVTGQTLTPASLGRDEFLSFTDGQWVEIVDDWMDFATQRGVLLRILHVDPATQHIEIDPATPVPAVDASRPVVLYRWDQTTGADQNGMPMSAASIPLEAGLEIGFAAGSYRPGDYWLIPARTAINGLTGQIEWPHDSGGPIAQPPRGIRHHFTRLALVDFNAATKAFTVVEDCRAFFPPLNNIDAADVGFDNTVCSFPGTVDTVQQAIDALCARGGENCTVSLAPGDNLQALINTLPAGADARICLRVGSYTLDAPLEIVGKGHVVIAGGGPGTHLIAAKGECALRITGCASASVRDCAFGAHVAANNNDGLGDIGGALTIADCPSVDVASCTFQCAPAVARSAACLVIRNTVPPTTRADVTGCTMIVGHGQVGILVSGMDTVHLAGNEIAAGGKLPSSGLELRWHALVRAMIGKPTVGAVGSPPLGKPNSVTFSGVTVFFALDPSLGTGIDLQGFINSFAPPTKMSTRGARRHFIHSLQDRVRRTAEGRVPTTPLELAMQRLVQNEPVVAGAGIIVAGDRTRDVVVTNNRIGWVIQGIVVAPSHSGKAVAAVDRIRIAGNAITVDVASGAMTRLGVLIGNSNSLLVVENRIAGPATPPAIPQRGRAEAIRIFGTIGNFAVVETNHITGMSVGINFAPLPSQVLPTKPQWIVTDNFAERAASVLATASAAIRGRIRGADANFS